MQSNFFSSYTGYKVSGDDVFLTNSTATAANYKYLIHGDTLSMDTNGCDTGGCAVIFVKE